MDATFWATIALVIFLGIMIYLKVPGMIAKSLDERSAKIKSDLDEARRLREEAQELLAGYQRKRKEAETEAASIVDQAKKEAENIAKDAEEKTAELIARRTAMAEQKIAQAEADALAEVRSTAVDLAIAAAEGIVAGKAKGATADKLLRQAISDVKRNLN